MTATKIDHTNNPYHKVLLILDKAQELVIETMGPDFKIIDDPKQFPNKIEDKMALAIHLIASKLSGSALENQVTLSNMKAYVFILGDCLTALTAIPNGLPVPKINNATSFKLAVAYAGLLSALDLKICPQAKAYTDNLYWIPPFGSYPAMLNKSFIKLNEDIYSYFKQITDETERQELFDFVSKTDLTELDTKIKYAMNSKTVDTAATKLAEVRKITNIWSLPLHESVILKERAKQLKRYTRVIDQQTGQELEQKPGHVLMTVENEAAIIPDDLSKNKPTMVKYQKEDGSTAYRMYQYNMSRKTCCAIFMDQEPVGDGATISLNDYFQSGFIRVKNDVKRLDSLWYLDKTTKKLIKIDISIAELVSYDSEISKTIEEKVRQLRIELEEDKKTEEEIEKLLVNKRSDLAKIMGLSDADFAHIQPVIKNNHQAMSEESIVLDLDPLNGLNPDNPLYSNVEYKGPAYADIIKVCDLPFPALGSTHDLPFDKQYSSVYNHTMNKYMKRSEKTAKSSAPTLKMIDDGFIESIAMLNEKMKALDFFDQCIANKNVGSSYQTFVDEFKLKYPKISTIEDVFKPGGNPEDPDQDDSEHVAQVVLTAIKGMIRVPMLSVVMPYVSYSFYSDLANTATAYVAAHGVPGILSVLTGNTFRTSLRQLDDSLVAMNINYTRQSLVTSRTRNITIDEISSASLDVKQIIAKKKKQLEAKRDYLIKQRPLLTAFIEHENAIKAFEKDMKDWMAGSNELVEKLENRLKATTRGRGMPTKTVREQTGCEIDLFGDKLIALGSNYRKLKTQMISVLAPEGCKVRLDQLLKSMARLGDRLIDLTSAQSEIVKQERGLLAREKIAYAFGQILISQTAMFTSSFQFMLSDTKIIPWLSLVALIVGAVAAIIALGVLTGNPHFALFIVPALAGVVSPLCLTGAVLGTTAVAASVGGMSYRFFALAGKRDKSDGATATATAEDTTTSLVA